MKQVFLLAVCMFSLVPISSGQEIMPAPNRVVLNLKANVQPDIKQLAHQRFGFDALDQVNEQYRCTKIHTIKAAGKEWGGVYCLTFANAIHMSSVTEQYLQTGLVKYAEPDHTGTLGDNKTTGTLPNDTWFSRQWGLFNDGSFPFALSKTGADIEMLQAWDVEDGDSTVVVAVIDAGCKMDHPEFAGRLWRNYLETPGDNIDNDNNGYTDDTLGWNTAYGTNDPSDDNGHGVNVAGIIGANSNNADGYSGIDQHCKLMIVKAADATGFFAYSWLAEAIYYAVDNGAHIINISAGGATPSNITQDAINYAHANNVLVVAAMMNAGNSIKYYPAACDHVMAVGATGPTDKRAGFSNYGSHISVVAPGEHIYGLSHLSDTDYSVAMSGTSQATPHVAGLAALLLAQDKNRTPAQVRLLIETNAEDLVGDGQDSLGFERYYGHGRINAHRALTNAVLTVEERHLVNHTQYIYPNPSKDIVYLKNTQPTSSVEITIHDLNGKIMLKQNSSENPTRLDTRHLNAGLYFVTVIRDGKTFRTRLLKQ